MELEITDLLTFKAVFRGITKFADVARFDVSRSGLRIRSIDPYDFCYVDIKLRPAFFGGIGWKSMKFSSEAEIGKLRQVISKITSSETVFLDIGKEGIGLNFVNSGMTRYDLNWQDDRQFDLPEPPDFKYDAEITIPSGEFLEAVDGASAVAKEIFFEVQAKRFLASAHNGDFSYSRTIESKGLMSICMNKASKNVKCPAILDYLKTVSYIAARCEKVKLSLSDKMPLRVDLSYKKQAEFKFILSNKVLDARESSYKQDRKYQRPIADAVKENLLRTSVTKFPEFLESIGDGVPLKDLMRSRHETENGDYSRLGNMLKFTVNDNGIISLSDDGTEFLKSLTKKSAKDNLNKKLKKNIPEYRYLLGLLKDQPRSFGWIVSSFRKSKECQVSKEDILLLLGLATWCNSIDRKFGLYYFGK